MPKTTTDITRFKRGYWAENWRRTLRDWEGRQSVIGVVLLVVALLGYGAIAEDPVAAQIGAVVAGLYLAINFSRDDAKSDVERRPRQHHRS